MIVKLFSKNAYRLPAIEGPANIVNTSEKSPSEFASPEEMKAYLLAKIEDMSADTLRFYTTWNDDREVSDLSWAVAADAHNGTMIRYKDGRLGWERANNPNIRLDSKSYFMSREEALETPMRRDNFFMSQAEIAQGIQPFPVNITYEGDTRALNIGAWIMNEKIGECDIEELVAGYSPALNDLVISYKQAGCPSVDHIKPLSDLEIEVDVEALREYLEDQRPEIMNFQPAVSKP
ncbi:hypothetical protein [Sulfitobacter sp. R18_1]|uniref:hypothetical protein n=1 Tax=Sulfitobacter sp. R18_1 TaxID=2821104 RepID=UPI001ADC2EDD|nr:hypothetical protein [Sulfitobacter sp. R18_1]MBO9428801.1 hypothetical protein [Sulfitobacter sp. R18_1]